MQLNSAQTRIQCEAPLEAPLLPKPRKQTLRARIYDVLEGKAPFREPAGLPGKYVNKTRTNHLVCSAQGSLGSFYTLALTTVILVNIASFMLSTEPSMTEHQPLSSPYPLLHTQSLRMGSDVPKFQV